MFSARCASPSLALQELWLGAVVQPGTTTTKQDMVDWNQLLVDTSGPDPAAARGAKSSGVKGEAVVALAGLLRQGFKTLEKLDLRGCFMGVGMPGYASAGCWGLW